MSPILSRYTRRTFSQHSPHILTILLLQHPFYGDDTSMISVISLLPHFGFNQYISSHLPLAQISPLLLSCYLAIWSTCLHLHLMLPVLLSGPLADAPAPSAYTSLIFLHLVLRYVAASVSDSKPFTFEQHNIIVYMSISPGASKCMALSSSTSAIAS